MRLSIGHKLVVAFAGALAILLATGVVSYRNTRRLEAANDAVSASQAILQRLAAVTRATLEAEGATRAYLLTADPAARAQVVDAASTAREGLDRLSTLVAPDREGATATATLAAATAQRLDELALALARRDRSGAASAPTLLAGSDSAGSAARLRAAADHLESTEEDRLARRAVDAHAVARRSELILRVGLILVALLAPLAFLIVRGDLEGRRQTERLLEESEARLRAAADGSMDAFYVLRAVHDEAGALADFEFVDLNARAASLLGHDRRAILGERLCELLPRNRSDGFFDRYRRVMETGAVLEEEFEVAGGEYTAAWIHHQVVPLRDGVAITSRDITERKQQEEALRALSLVDELTGLYNRRGFLALAQQQLKLARRGHREVVLLFVDMDDFKEINDTFGHNEGDVALTRAAQVLRKTFRDSDILARLGGDEFVVLATDTAAATSDIIVSRMRRELQERNEEDGYPYRLSFSVGAARFDPDAPPSIEELLATADSMLYQQKRHRRATEAPAERS
jgi:diguanylate cyclase (GGDEF)-like protein/PAS domain S-box-containing protein